MLRDGNLEKLSIAQDISSFQNQLLEELANTTLKRGLFGNKENFKRAQIIAEKLKHICQTELSSPAQIAYLYTESNVDHEIQVRLREEIMQIRYEKMVVDYIDPCHV